jgi:putative PIN family toxin of toxin-antitoxin system
MRIVLDTNVLIAAFISRGACAELLEHCALRHELICSEHILDEFRKNLVEKFGISRRDAAEAARLLESRMVLVEPEEAEDVSCRDPDDRPVLGTALAGRCRCLVTGDKDLLVLDRCRDVRILSPSAFWSFEESVEG